MERTDKVKIALGILLVALAVRLLLGFFPIPLDFAPYDNRSETGQLQTVSFTAIRLCMTVKQENTGAMYYYLLRTEDEQDGLLASSTLYFDETFSEPVVFTGITVVLPDPDAVAPDAEAAFYAKFTFAEDFLKEHEGEAAEAYRTVQGLTALDATFQDKTKENPACFWVSLAAAAAFCWMLALLLREYLNGRRKKAPAKESSSADI